MMSLLSLWAVGVAALAMTASSALGQASPEMMSSRNNPNVDDPVVMEDGQGGRVLVFPESFRIPRYASDTAREFLANRSEGRKGERESRACLAVRVFSLSGCVRREHRRC